MIELATVVTDLESKCSMAKQVKRVKFIIVTNSTHEGYKVTIIEKEWYKIGAKTNNK